MNFRPSLIKYKAQQWLSQILYTMRYMPSKRLSSYLQYYFFDFRRVRSIYKNSSFCILPWIHMYVDPVGEFFPCCVRAPGMNSFGNINKTSVEAVWNSSQMKTLRKDMLGNQPRPDVCGTCYKREKKEGNSHRLGFNKKFFHLIPVKIKSTQEDGSVNDLNWSYWDFRLSNKCNFRCRTCGPEHSTAWQAELNSPDNTVRENNRPGWQAGFEYFLKNSQNIEEIYFAGGEPLLIDEHYHLLEWLIQNKKTNIVLSYNTNLSILEYKDWKILDLWKKFKYVYVSPSIDHFGKKAELIRKGTNWTQVEKNLKTILKEKHIQVRPTLTISALNILDFVEIHKYFFKMGLIKTINHFALNMVLQPEFFSVSILPEEQKAIVRKNLTTYDQFLISQYGEGIQGLNLILHELDLDKSYLRAQFMSELKRIDTLRDETLHHDFLS